MNKQLQTPRVWLDGWSKSAKLGLNFPRMTSRWETQSKPCATRYDYRYIYSTQQPTNHRVVQRKLLSRLVFSCSVGSVYITSPWWCQAAFILGLLRMSGSRGTTSRWSEIKCSHFPFRFAPFIILSILHLVWDERVPVFSAESYCTRLGAKACSATMRSIQGAALGGFWKFRTFRANLCIWNIHSFFNPRVVFIFMFVFLVRNGRSLRLHI